MTISLTDAQLRVLRELQGTADAEHGESLNELQATRFPVEIRLNAAGHLDEVVSPFVHLEQMDVNHWWLAVYDGKGSEGRVTVGFHARGRISAHVEREGAMEPAAAETPR